LKARLSASAKLFRGNLEERLGPVNAVKADSYTTLARRDKTNRLSKKCNGGRRCSRFGEKINEGEKVEKKRNLPKARNLLGTTPTKKGLMSPVVEMHRREGREHRGKLKEST